MTLSRAELIQTIWKGREPFDGFEAQLYRTDHGGWGSSHPYLQEAVSTLRPKLIVEIGVWNGASVRTMAECLRNQAIQGTVLAVDTWLGSAEHWIDNPAGLCFAQGRPGKQFVFMANVLEWGLVDYVVPLPLDSLNAAAILTRYRIDADLIHLDGSHDYESVAADLRQWWPRLRPGGMLIGDDYHDDPAAWPGVKRAFDEFFAKLGISAIEHHTGKCRIRKAP